eukprot:CAMPEP_0202971602 /NCGR_PEP_ID=MMETSP1396-20130829/28592_1 /ASSEMBLY_ACC=CAM_ASM_000872 /TAXON_ID= /ORGANISM="Pseudokeronopsis sp., Strain Brazil" /LENGTH=47 /DNA_ID= /DNA_START= /DNA_END= /DNA_ORIENTATION=
MPISDGGEGFLDCLTYHFKDNSNVELRSCEVQDPLMRPIEGVYLLDS